MKLAFKQLLSSSFSKEQLWNKDVYLKFFLLAIISLIIGSLLAPKLFNRQEFYKEGDVIRQNIVVENDMMIEDVVSTRLKQQQLLSEQGQIFDYDPGISSIAVARIKKAFQEARSEFSNLENEMNQRNTYNLNTGVEYFNLTQELYVIQASINTYNKYQNKINDDLSILKLGVKLSSKNFKKKQRLDWELNTISYALAALQKNKESIQLKIKILREGLNNLTEQEKELQISYKEKKETIIHNVFKNLFIAPDEIDHTLIKLPFYSEEIESEVIKIIKQLLSQKIISSKKAFSSDAINIEIQNLKTGNNRKFNNLDDFKDLDEVHQTLNELTEKLFINDPQSTKRDFINWLIRHQLYPTVTENKLALEKKREHLIQSMNPVFYSVKKGQVIARAGERVSRNQVQLIKGYLDSFQLEDSVPRFIGVILITFFSLLLVYIAVFNKAYIKSFSSKKLILMGTTIILTMILVKVGIEIKELIELRYIDFNSEYYNYVFPITLSAMLVGILVNFEVGVMSGLLTSLFVSIMMKDNFYFFYFSMMGSVVAALPMSKFDSRYSLIQHGLKISLVNVVMVLLLFLINENHIDSQSILAFVMAFLGGIVTALITSILLPFYESIFDITTNLKLLELSNMNHPLLKELIFKAPGTYQHSIIVGNLSEAGADKIGANSLLARVSSYYHDIGKGENPHFFIENQPAHSKNIHDEMDPYTSAGVIFKHLTDGKIKAEKHSLGKNIIDILMQHHGTGLMKIFYQKAVNQAEEAIHDIEVNETDFRYPGPKPQTLEAALVMIADISEAATRSLDDPTPDSIYLMINKLGWGLLESGQLDESGITLKQFRIILDEYCNVLTSIHHHRIKYPGN